MFFSLKISVSSGFSVKSVYARNDPSLALPKMEREAEGREG
jgi:hypothetical protein